MSVTEAQEIVDKWYNARKEVKKWQARLGGGRGGWEAALAAPLPATRGIAAGCWCD